ncbi:MAG: mannose-6-phosphate isomerase [Chloroflexaceae bacterium]|nr:mannose-6-phosphate isomerase [Chloroflexaceae bacterium]NJO07123.1 mannose-6-phosphate isomerase [Chloroflexaceae bacterium]
MSSITLYPLLPKQQLVPRIWGGQHLASQCGGTLPTDDAVPIGECWLVYDTNPILNGEFAGQTLAEVTCQLGALLVGERAVARYGNDFPLLVKFLDAAERLSIQVHPDDDYAHLHEAHTGFHGKTEAWYILDARPDATIIYGLLEPCDRTTFANAVAGEECEQLLRYVPVQKGDTFLVPARTIHAINAGVMLYEIQQKSDLTYRVYDYGRRDPKTGQLRELHLDKALDVINFATVSLPPRQEITLDDDGQRVQLITCDFFTLERWNITSTATWATDPATLEILTVVGGHARLEWEQSSIEMTWGASVVLPAALGTVRLVADRAPAQVLRAYIPESTGV